MIGAGGTPGGEWQFLGGLALSAVGFYLLTQQVSVSSGLWQVWGYNAFGLSLVPFLIGTGLLFFNGRSPAGWLLMGLGLLVIGAGILSNLTIYFQPTSLFNTLMMLGMMAAGVGLIAQSLRPR